MSDMTDEAERKAMAEFQGCCDAHYNGRARGGWTFTIEALSTLKRMLSRPVLPPSASDELVDVMHLAFCTTPSESKRAIASAYRALYAHLTAPRTKEVEVWHVEYAENGEPIVHLRRSQRAAEDHAREVREWMNSSCVRVTGPHKQTVPAE